MRRNLGESLASVGRLDVPICDATTWSLEAWKAFSQGEVEPIKGDNRGAMAYYRVATEIDPNFALAYQMSDNHNNVGEPGLSEQYCTKAFDLRQRATERERLGIEATYYLRVLGDPNKAIETHRVLAQMYPRDWRGFNSLGLSFGKVGQNEEAVKHFQEAAGVGGEAVVFPYGNLAVAYMRLNRFAGTARPGEVSAGHLRHRFPSEARWLVLPVVRFRRRFVDAADA